MNADNWTHLSKASREKLKGDPAKGLPGCPDECPACGKRFTRDGSIPVFRLGFWQHFRC